nr:immunoglobulin light chain junction region [Macaca mulatta]MPO03025.1 immunoglobulin light chain junction region [Macaca mulatta]MPO03048.1 immunoglobulin light chain junction region [Macaca mulatta]MPO03394.1 immunoglobulin light chain junction region [Macaca mulatta]MPO05311.1 immunoglobulin light chain junction region [Macaca mulatta]
CLIWHNSAYIF